MKKIVTVVALSLALLAGLAGPASARMERPALRWPGHFVCVEDHTPRGFPVGRAVWDWNRTRNLRVVWRSDCPDGRPKVTVRAGRLPKTIAGRTWWRATEDGTIVSAHIRLARWRFLHRWGLHMRHAVTRHEIGHALGLGHDKRPRWSIMRPYLSGARPWWTTPYDRRNLARAYD